MSVDEPAPWVTGQSSSVTHAFPLSIRSSLSTRPSTNACRIAPSASGSPRWRRLFPDRAVLLPQDRSYMVPDILCAGTDRMGNRWGCGSCGRRRSLPRERRQKNEQECQSSDCGSR
jgi:hypothetical protein